VAAVEPAPEQAGLGDVRSSRFSVGGQVVKGSVAIVSVCCAILSLAPMMTNAQEDGFRASEFEYGPRYDVDEPIEIWNPVKQKFLDGDEVITGLSRTTDPRIYCAMADAGYDFIWTEKQHEATSWETAARMWRTCPHAMAVPGVRVAYADEREIQHATDMGALVIAVPTVDSVEEAQEAINWTYFPPMGRRSLGGGQGPSEMWNDVPGGYRETWNENVVLILMIETLEGVEATPEIAKLPGVTAIAAASGDLGNFSGYSEGDPEYDMLVDIIRDAALENGIGLCGPLAWRGREGFNCYWTGPESSVIRRGVADEIGR
jgi:2-keto-3-deoxy-L-rhamnonate aldolase RhmA